MDPRQPSSFLKSLFFGQIPEEMVIPYPRLTPPERAELASVVQAVRAWAAQHDAAAIDQSRAIPPAVREALRRIGLFGLSIPPEYGGRGFGATATARVGEEVARADASVALMLAGHGVLGTMGLLLHGSAEQRRRYLPRLASGEWLAAFALTEPTSGSDAASITSRAIPTGDGGFVLDGKKTWIVNGADADLYTVFAQTEVEKAGGKADRITGFLVERNQPGVEVSTAEPTLGARGAAMATLTLRDVRVARENVLGRVGGGFKVAMTVLNAGRLGSSAASVGAAKQLLALVIPYTRARRQFGRPIGEFGLIKDKLGRMAMDVFAAESMVYLTTGLIDRGVADTSVESAICKVFASETLWRVANESLAIAAGQGFVEGPPWERLMRDARAHLVFQGTNEILRCFIALSGMQGPGERLAQLADFIKWPLKGYGLAIDFVVDKLTQVVGGKVLEHADAMLKREAVYFEDSVPELAKQVEKTLRKHGKMISEMQFVQRRVADMAIDLYLMVACIARATTSIAEKGAPEAERETKLCRAACGRAATRIRRTIRQFDDNDDELLKALAKDATDAATYPFDGVL